MPPEIERRVEITKLRSDVQHLTTTVEKNTTAVEGVLVILQGDGGIGLVTQTALNKHSLSRLWKVVATFFTAATGLIIGLGSWLIRKHL